MEWKANAFVGIIRKQQGFVGVPGWWMNDWPLKEPSLAPQIRWCSKYAVLKYDVLVPARLLCFYRWRRELWVMGMTAVCVDSLGPHPLLWLRFYLWFSLFAGSQWGNVCHADAKHWENSGCLLICFSSPITADKHMCVHVLCVALY